MPQGWLVKRVGKLLDWLSGTRLPRDDRELLPKHLPLKPSQINKPSHIFWDIENLPLPSTLKKNPARFTSKLRLFFTASRIITAVENPVVAPATSELLGVLSAHCNVEVLSYIRPKLKGPGLEGTADWQIKQAIARFTEDNPVGSTITLITSDADFTPDVAKAKESGFHVNLLCDQLRSNYRLKDSTNWHYDWKTYLKLQFPEEHLIRQTRPRHRLLSTKLHSAARSSRPQHLHTSDHIISQASLHAEVSAGKKERFHTVTGYPTWLPDEHLLLHALASARTCGHIASVLLVSGGHAGKCASLRFAKAIDARRFKNQNRLQSIGFHNPVPVILGMQGPLLTAKRSDPDDVIVALTGFPSSFSFQDAERSAAELCRSIKDVHFVIGTWGYRQNVEQPIAFISMSRPAFFAFESQHPLPLKVSVPTGMGSFNLSLEWRKVVWREARHMLLAGGPSTHDSDDKFE